MTENQDASLWENPLQEFRNRVAKATPTPGGGSVAAVTASLAAALMQMVCSISVKRKPDAQIDAIAKKAKLFEEELTRCAEEDIQVFDRYISARQRQNPSGQDDIQRCLLACAEVPLAAAEAAAKLETYAAELAPGTPEFLSSDLATARYLLQASRRALLENVAVNLKDLKDGEAKRVVLKRLKMLQDEENLAG